MIWPMLLTTVGGPCVFNATQEVRHMKEDVYNPNILGGKYLTADFCRLSSHTSTKIFTLDFSSKKESTTKNIQIGVQTKFTIVALYYLATYN